MLVAPIRHSLIALFILATAWWSLAAAASSGTDPTTTDHVNAQLLATPAWLQERLDAVLVVDVRTDEHFDGTLIPGAIRLPWSRFRQDNPLSGIGVDFVGVEQARTILGDHGISRGAELVLYDSVTRDGGATASYVFWVLDLLGHEHKRILDGGIDAWQAAGGELVHSARSPEPLAYAVRPADVQQRALIHGSTIHQRLDDPHYQIIDTRSPEEYSGAMGSRGISGQDLKRGHIPGAVNIPYTRAWMDEEDKRIRSQTELEALYAGLDPARTQVVYCNSGRRSSFSYFILRLMGFPRVTTYEASWKEWGLPRAHLPVSTEPTELESDAPPGLSSVEEGRSRAASGGARRQEAGDDGSHAPQSSGSGSGSGDGYVSCGG
ncbi:MAG: sulfurtransferase [Planctomycetota bacterium]